MKVLIINGHPKEGSYSDALCAAYQEGAQKAGAHVEVLNIRDLKFDVNLQYGYEQEMGLEEDLTMAIEKMKACDHMLWVHPLWWYGYPAIMKGFIDRTFLPGVTYKYEKGAALPTPLLKGKTARIICTADSPWWYYKFFKGSPATKQLKQGTLEFCGVKPVKTTYIAPIRQSTEAFRLQWLDKVKKLGERLS